VNQALTTDDPTKIKDAVERLKNSSMEIGKAIYSQQSSSSEQQSSEGQQEEAKKDEEKK